MINAGTVQVKLFADTKQYMTAMRAAGAQMKTLGTSTQAFAGIAITAFAAFSASAAKMATDFDKRLREISTLIIGVTEKDIKNMSREIRDLANVTGKALDDIGKAKYDIISAGFTGMAESASLLDSATRLAVGGVTSVTNAADLLTSALNSFQKSGFEAEEAADILFTTVRLGKTTMDELVGSVGRVFPTAQRLGASLADVGAAMATITAGGIKTYEAATYLNQAFTKLGAPSDQAAKAMARYGIEIYRTDNGMLDLLRTIKQFQGYDLEQMRKFFPEIRAIKAVLAMANNLDFLERSLRDTQNATGATQTAFEKMTKAWSTQLNKSVMQLKDTMVEIGDDIMPTVVKYFSKFVVSIKDMKGVLKTVPKIFLALLDSFVGIIKMLPSLILMFGTYKIATIALTTGMVGLLGVLKSTFAFMAAINPYALAIAGLVGLAGMIVQSWIEARNEIVATIATGENIKFKDVSVGYMINVSAYFDKEAEKFLELTKEEEKRRLKKQKSEYSTAFPYAPAAKARFDFLEKQKENLPKYDTFELAYKTIFGEYADAVLGAYNESFIYRLEKYNPPSLYELLFGDKQGYDIAMSQIQRFVDELDFDKIAEISQIKIGGARIGVDLQIEETTKQLENFYSLLISAPNVPSMSKIFDLSGVDLNNFFKATKIVESLGINLKDVAKYDLSSLGIDTIELEDAYNILVKLFGSIDNAKSIWDSFGDNGKQQIKDIKTELVSLSEVISREYSTAADTIASTMNSAFADIILSGRTAAKELEDYNNGITNSFRTQDEIISESWADMWDRILRTVVENVAIITAEIALITGAILLGDALTKGAVSAALTSVQGMSKIVDASMAFANILSGLFNFSASMDRIGGAGSGDITTVQDAVITPSGQVVQTDPKDYLIATKTPQDLGGGGGDIFIEIKALDGADVERVLMRNPQAVARGVGHAVERRNLRLTPSGKIIKAEY